MTVWSAAAALAQPNQYTFHWGVVTDWAFAKQTGVDWGDEIPLGDAPIKKDVKIVYQHQLGWFPLWGLHLVYMPIKTPGMDPDLPYMQQHLEKIASDLDIWVPGADYDGMIVIDYEMWNCHWDRTNNQPSGQGPYAEDRDFKDDWRDYQASLSPVFEKLTPEQQEYVLRTTWEAAAKDFYLSTILRVKELRPKAKVGVFQYPIKILKQAKETAPKVIGYGDHSYLASARNDQLAWMFEAADFLAPQLYAPRFVKLQDEPYDEDAGEWPFWDYHEYLLTNVREAVRLGKGKPVYPVFWCRYHQPTKKWNYYDKQLVSPLNLRMQIHVGRLAGASGLILWEGLITMEEVNQLTDWVSSVYLPEVIGASRGG